jgi:hypothetical protein
MDIQPLEILKWIGIVLAAGFIGYFGRYLAMKILGQTQKKEHPTQPVQVDESRLKLEKKKAKLTVKQTKKAGKE